MRRSTLLLGISLALAFGLPIAFALRSLVWLDWRVTLEQPAVAGPLLAGDRVLVATRDGLLHAFDRADAAVRWRAPCGTPLSAESVATRDALVLCAAGGRLLALDLETGFERFQQQLEDGGSSAVVALGADLLLVAVGDTLTGVARNGASGFRATPWPGRAITSLRLADDFVLATSAARAGDERGAAGAGGVAALAAADGALRWIRELDAPVERAVERSADLVFALAAANPPQVVALELASGAVRWSGPGETTPIASGTTAIDALGATLRARDLASGAPRWEKVGFEAAWSAAPTRAAELALVAFGPSLFAFRPGGEQVFVYPLRGRIGPQLAGDAARVFYVEDGTRLIALDVD